MTVFGVVGGYLHSKHRVLLQALSAVLVGTVGIDPMAGTFIAKLLWFRAATLGL
jgi:hypothetical protein